MITYSLNEKRTGFSDNVPEYGLTFACPSVFGILL